MLAGLTRWIQNRKQEAVKAYWRAKRNACAHGPVIFEALQEEERRALTRVLEFGASWGGNLQYLMERLPGLQGVGVDVNPVVTELAETLQGYRGIVGDERALAQLPDHAFSLAFTVSVLDHIPHADVVENIISHLVRIADRVLLVEPWIEGVHREVSGKIRNAIKPGLPRGHKPFAPHCFVWDYDAMLRRQQMEWRKTPMPLHEASLGPFYHLYDIRPRTGVSVGMVAA